MGILSSRAFGGSHLGEIAHGIFFEFFQTPYLTPGQVYWGSASLYTPAQQTPRFGCPGSVDVEPMRQDHNSWLQLQEGVVYATGTDVRQLLPGPKNVSRSVATCVETLNPWSALTCWSKQD